MALLIPDYPDSHDVPGVTIPAAYGWIPDLTISYSDGRATFGFWVHRSQGAADSWPGGARIQPIDRLRIAAGDPVPGHPDVVFPGLDDLMGRAATGAIARLSALGLVLNAEQAAAVADIATGGEIRASLYGNLNELVFPNATEVD